MNILSIHDNESPIAWKMTLKAGYTERGRRLIQNYSAKDFSSIHISRIYYQSTTAIRFLHAYSRSALYDARIIRQRKA